MNTIKPSRLSNVQQEILKLKTMENLENHGVSQLDNLKIANRI